LIIFAISGKRKINKMTQEIERKFKVLTENLPDLSNLTPTWVSQSYLWKNPEIRVRISKRNNHSWAILTIKSKSFLSRFEKNIRIPFWLADYLFSLGIDPVIKERFKIPRQEKQNHFWELDCYVSNLSLWVAEVELDCENEILFCPEWVGEEVTFDARYYAANIAKTLRDRIYGTFQEKKE
jgi:CYTH domain-containing protein